MNKYNPPYSAADVEAVKSGTAPASAKFARVKYRDGKLWVGELEVVPIEQAQELVRRLYNDPQVGLSGRDKMYDYIKTRYAGLSRRDVFAYLKNLETNQVHAAPARVAASTSKRPLEHWGVDTVFIKDAAGEEKFIILTAIDTFSKYAWARFIEPSRFRRSAADETTRVMREILEGEGPSHLPSTIQTDNGAEFKNAAFEGLLDHYGIKHIYSPAHQPTANAVVERFNGTLKRRLYRFMTNYNAMQVSDEDLRLIVAGYNNQMHATTKSSPTSVHTGRSRQTRAAKTVKKREPLEVGDYVRVALRADSGLKRETTPKKQSYVRQWSYEMYKIVDISKSRTTRYQLAKKNGTLLARKFLRQELMPVDKSRQVRESKPDEYVVEAVLDKRRIGGVTKYLCRWRGYDEPTWERPHKSYQRLIDEYNARTSA